LQYGFVPKYNCIPESVNENFQNNVQNYYFSRKRENILRKKDKKSSFCKLYVTKWPKRFEKNNTTDIAEDWSID